jgi:hypothetical protein
LQDPKGTTSPRNKIKEMTAATLSAMPNGLLSSFTRDEILDLLAYLRSDRLANMKPGGPVARRN